MSQRARSIISDLLEVDPSARLGSGPAGFRDIREHKFFETIDWERLEQRLVVPPYMPPRTIDDMKPQFDSFNEMLIAYGKESWCRDAIDKDSDMRFFGTWDFVSKEAQRIEFGLANQMEQYETNMKVRQLLGENSRTPSKKLSASIKEAAIGLLGNTSMKKQSSIKLRENALSIALKKANQEANQLEAELSLTNQLPQLAKTNDTV